MLCYEFEDRLTDYLDGALDVETHKNFAAHAIRCPVCHDLLSEVKNTLVACSASEAPPASAGSGGSHSDEDNARGLANLCRV